MPDIYVCKYGRSLNQMRAYRREVYIVGHYNVQSGSGINPYFCPVEAFVGNKDGRIVSHTCCPVRGTEIRGLLFPYPLKRHEVLCTLAHSVFCTAVISMFRSLAV